MTDGYRWETCARIARLRLIAILRARDARTATEVGTAVADAGLDVIEVSLTQPGALDAVAALARARPGALVGAGTVLDAASARLALLAGARFLVTPSLVPETIACGHRYGVPVVAGVATASELGEALALGADLIKLFPSDQFEPSIVSALHGPFPQAPLVPTGGITAATAPAWIAAGAVALGVGGPLLADPATAGERASELLAAVR
ncbi:bifunctional 4-hydroxy-2-oxoglutarate aldolase/2-dehydro-3-deoxy-phosphogluconate aldolase [Conexibacter sp. JD483]|uniref:bifunctional 4-hydroxy-2-oxoglutarate aldolase/2-dehydro-3-deoxy-phosphogluconate aldolase n=1 Tax=unclassified Conexibacter TaxID=2627773 RepID=UPI00271BE807|nr:MULTISPECIES: bifunctional 4-hydroxy-2-oxoglutarate aldolase/2-dehydro-3-deoxy-phosphogluconate aldolase [unclassified Conexibacter]MDO8185190.1 bifunctional 4-hydroxy-2-oxoglutarate aldolase/2-dehydro-3-deoxy-phosphogluconate aldolase [Conexibacter sp. CPCC 205706]MDO8198236.1 bifunctional 4-hydroxy-2-oxoglutarate aldolase/2-dehydro-3-deoxy-phosphogluconate aldolase [Conexibacter sp. CPCC 205762]MDR9367802.1 bifunctional 4-hydroxy-2-oxoglutarate aldolase/2-dehydro-3-deoxy-phosphogluconate al